jgi:hypothetical protein
MYSYLSSPISKKIVEFDIANENGEFLIMFDGSIVAIKTELISHLRERVVSNYLGYSKDDAKGIKLDNMDNLTLACAYRALASELEEDKSDPDWEPDEDYDYE